MAGGKMGGSIRFSGITGLGGYVDDIILRSPYVCVQSDCPEGFVRVDILRNGGKMAGGKMGSSDFLFPGTRLSGPNFSCVRAVCPDGFVRVATSGGKMAGGKMGSSSSDNRFIGPNFTCVRSDCPDGFVRASAISGGKMAGGKRGSIRTDFTCVRANTILTTAGKMGGKRGSSVFGAGSIRFATASKNPYGPAYRGRNMKI